MKEESPILVSFDEEFRKKIEKKCEEIGSITIFNFHTHPSAHLKNNENGAEIKGVKGKKIFEVI